MFTNTKENDFACVFSCQEKLRNFTGFTNLELSHKNRFVHIVKGDLLSLQIIVTSLQQQDKHRYTVAIFDEKGVERSFYETGKSNLMQ